MYSTQHDTSLAAPARRVEARMDALDLGVLASYEHIQLAGDPDFIVELIDLYRDDAPRRVAMLRESLAQRDWRLFKREAHSLKGSSGSVGAARVALICDELEVLEAEPLLLSQETYLARLDQELEQAFRLLANERQRRL